MGLRIKIDPEFERLVIPLSDKAFDALRENILAEGEVFVPIYTWYGNIIDGHNRYRVIQEHPEIEFKVREKSFSDRREVIAWICKNQRETKSLTSILRAILIGEQYEAVKKAHGAAERFRGNQYVTEDFLPVQDGCEKSHPTRKKISQETDTSESYVKRAGQMARAVHAGEEVCANFRKKIYAGEIRPTQDDLIGILNATPLKRTELIEALISRNERTVGRGGAFEWPGFEDRPGI